MSENKEKEIKLTPFTLYTHNLKYSFSYASIFGAILVLTLLLGYFVPFTFILTIPLIIVPSTFALAMVTISLNANIPYSFKSFFRSLKLYFSTSFMGVYRVIMGILKSLVVFAIVYILIFGITIAIMINQDAELVHMITSGVPQVDIENYILTNPLYTRTAYLFLSAAIVAASLMFIHHLVVNTLKISLNVHTQKQIEMAKLNILFRYEFKYFRKTFYKYYITNVWFIYFIFVLGIVGGFVFNYFVISHDVSQCITLGFLFGFILLTYLIPYVINVVEFIYLGNYDEFMKASLKASNEILGRVQNTDLYKEHQKDIDELKESIDSLFETDEEDSNKDNDDEDDSSHQ